MTDSIEGVPVGYRLKRIGTPKAGDPYLAPSGSIEICEGGFQGFGYAVLEKIKKETKTVEVTRWVTVGKSHLSGEYFLVLATCKSHLAQGCPEPQQHTFRFEVQE